MYIYIEISPGEAPPLVPENLIKLAMKIADETVIEVANKAAKKSAEIQGKDERGVYNQ